jgi:hypothetical protein
LRRLPSSAPTVPENVYTAHLSSRLRKWPADAAEPDRERPAPDSGGNRAGLTHGARAGACMGMPTLCHTNALSDDYATEEDAETFMVEEMGLRSPLE